MKMRFHVLTPQHTVANDDYCACAYSGKARRLSAMMKRLGHTVFFYGHERSVVECDELIPVTTDADLKGAYGDFDYRKDFFRFDTNDSCYQAYDTNAIREITARKQPRDFLLATWGSGHRKICDAHSDLLVTESGCGYAGGFFARWRVYESYALLHAYLGLRAVGEAGHCENYSVCIPNYFDVSQFTFDERKEDYFLCLGRVSLGKGVQIAIQLAEAVGFRLVLAGQGKLEDVGYGGEGQPPVPPNVTFVGYAGVEERRRLLSKARGLFLLSQYLEPYGGVTIEAMLSGTPVITSDWGVFPETVPHGLVGYRCRTFADMLWAVQNIGNIRPAACREWAESNYSMERVALMYEKFFHDVMDVYTGRGWYEPHPERTELSWLEKRYPMGSTSSSFACLKDG